MTEEKMRGVNGIFEALFSHMKPDFEIRAFSDVHWGPRISMFCSRAGYPQAYSYIDIMLRGHEEVVSVRGSGRERARTFKRNKDGLFNLDGVHRACASIVDSQASALVLMERKNENRRAASKIVAKVCERNGVSPYSYMFVGQDDGSIKMTLSCPPEKFEVVIPMLVEAGLIKKTEKVD